MIALDPEISALFDRYLAAWNTRDFDAVAECYSYPALFVLPHASVPVADKTGMIDLLGHIFSGLEADGFSHTEIGAVTAASCGEGLAIVDATDVCRLRGDGSVLETIDAHYVVRHSDGAWFFTLAVTCKPGWRSPAA